jgi:hypothetical protein
LGDQANFLFESCWSFFSIFIYPLFLCVFTVLLSPQFLRFQFVHIYSKFLDISTLINTACVPVIWDSCSGLFFTIFFVKFPVFFRDSVLNTGVH